MRPPSGPPQPPPVPQAPPQAPAAPPMTGMVVPPPSNNLPRMYRFLSYA